MPPSPGVADQEGSNEHPRPNGINGEAPPDPHGSKARLWITHLFALTFYLLTVLYAWHPEYVSRLEWVGGSPANALRLLAILSGVASPLITLCIGQALNDLRQLLLSRLTGLNLMDFLALQQGIGLGGLWDIIRFRHLRRLSPKAWALGKCVSMLVVPILNILILTKVDTSLRFYQITNVPASRGYGMGAFNASLAELMNPMTDLTFSTRFKDFLSDSDRVQETTPDVDRDECARNSSICRANYFVPGGVENFAPALLAGKNFSTAGAIQPVLALNQRGYYFEFEGDHAPVDYNPDTECIVHGFTIGAFQLCLRNTLAHGIQAYITVCPKDLASNATCCTDHSWHLRKGWRTHMTTYARFATVAYNGLNGTILSHKYTNDSLIPVNISASELLSVFDIILGSVNETSLFGSTLKLLGLSTNKPVFPLTVWLYFQGLDKRVEDDSRTNQLAATGLQSLLALAIYHCQGKDFNELRRLLGGDEESGAKNIGQDIIDIFPSVEPDTDIVPGIVRYDLNVDQSILIPYIVIAGTTLVLCLAMQIVRISTKLGRDMRGSSPFPPLDVLSECEVRYYDGGGRVPLQDGDRVLLQDFTDLNGESAHKQLVAAAKMRIVRTKPVQTGGPPNAVSDNDNEGISLTEFPQLGNGATARQVMERQRASLPTGQGAQQEYAPLTNGTRA